ncbi:hypothetical protein [Patiriisocius hiemis]|uniref:Sugar transporter n=1 Tax=Patiriisocius hiemis TaxID=3075604 RepID=A0ABU2Y9U3_9FLAO|nr:hypothetical protein [Constantimarinum sp. W242]MDT0554949.1 hypothetical protein [Constantimarinum sp. W242]
MMTTTNKPNTAFWIIAVLALLWNLMGLFQFFGVAFMLEAMVEALPEDQATLYTSIPQWYIIVFGIAVFSGVLACITMLIRKKITVVLFLISLLAVLVAQIYWIFATDVMDVIGPTAIAMPLIVIAIAIFLYFYSKGAAQKGWLR